MKTIALCLIILLSGCRNKGVNSIDELYRYVNQPENHLMSSKTINGVTITLTYHPTDIILWQVLDSSERQLNDSLYRIYSNYYYFSASFSNANHEAIVKNENGYFSNVLQNLSFRAEDFIFITTDNNVKIALSDYFFNRTYSYSKASDLLLVFPKEKLVTEKFKLNINDFGIGTGNQVFEFRVNDLNKAPRLLRI